MVAIVNAKNNIIDARYFYVCLIENLDVGHESKHTPQHITLIPPFIIEEQVALSVAKDVAEKLKPFNILLGKRDWFGPKKDIEVLLIKPNQSLNNIHLALIKSLKTRGVDIYTLYAGQFINNGFTPHITIKKFHPVIDKSKPLKVNHIAVIRKDKNVKSIIAKYIFN
jgi:2'-5' RNA ligase